MFYIVANQKVVASEPTATMARIKAKEILEKFPNAIIDVCKVNKRIYNKTEVVKTVSIKEDDIS